jgi:hypothetical protein
MTELPAGATQIPLEEVFQTIGELWFQNRQYQRLIAQLQQQQHQAAAPAPNGALEHVGSEL